MLGPPQPHENRQEVMRFSEEQIVRILSYAVAKAIDAPIRQHGVPEQFDLIDGNGNLADGHGGCMETATLAQGKFSTKEGVLGNGI